MTILTATRPATGPLHVSLLTVQALHIRELVVTDPDVLNGARRHGQAAPRAPLAPPAAGPATRRDRTAG